MKVIKLTEEEADGIALHLTEGAFEWLVAFDEIDGAFKIKIDGRTWSPPLGKVVE
jgi:chaperone required for assembly of F1-ATPase